MPEYVILLSVPGLRRRDVALMPRLRELTTGGDAAELVASFPGVTCCVQANMTTGVPSAEHGVVANGFYFRDQERVEMWTSPNSCIQAPQLWDILHDHDSSLTCASWFGLHSVGCGADYVCWPAPIHNPDGTESPWCYSKPASLFAELLASLGHFPLHHFWGPFANIQSTAWIVSSAIATAQQYRPNLFYCYLSHLDYAAQKSGPDSPEALQAVAELDHQIGRLVDGFREAYHGCQPLWLVASEYVISPVEHVCYPNRVLRKVGLLEVAVEAGREFLDLTASRAWALADHQLSHVFVKDHDPAIIDRAAKLFTREAGVAEVLSHAELQKYDLQHPNAGDLVVISEPTSWQAYYWWLDDALAPPFARTVDIHRKPGYDPAEMFWDPATQGISLDATRVRGSHGAPALTSEQRGVLLASQRGVFVERPLADTDVADIVLRQFGI